MPTLFLLCGLPASGKTTLAKELEREHSAVRLCPDEWILALLPEGYAIEERDRLRDPVETLQWQLTERLLTLNVDVIIEWGLWSRHERAALRDKARLLGANVRLYYLDVPFEELADRVKQRNLTLPDDSFFVDPLDLALWYAEFEPPDEAELATFDR